MKLTKNKIAKIQVGLGIFLIVIALIGGLYVTKKVFWEDTLITGTIKLSELWGDAQTEILGDDSEDYGREIAAHAVTGLASVVASIKVGMYVFALGAVILAAIGASLILSGLKTLAKK
jgi:hypothetical protein